MVLIVVCLLQDALTDMSYSMQPVVIDGVRETFVHQVSS